VLWFDRDEDMQSVTSLMSLSRVTDIANVEDVEDEACVFSPNTLSDSTMNDIRLISSQLDDFRTELNYDLGGA